MILLCLNVCREILNMFLIQLCWSQVILTFEASRGAAYEIKQECDCPSHAREIEKQLTIHIQSNCSQFQACDGQHVIIIIISGMQLSFQECNGHTTNSLIIGY